MDRSAPADARFAAFGRTELPRSAMTTRFRHAAGAEMGLENGVIVPLATPRAQLARVTQIRSTVVTTSLRSIRDRGYGARYFTHLPERHHDAIRACIAGIWIPVELGLAHYEACDALGLSDAEQMAIGQEVGLKVQGTVLGMVVKLAKATGVTPWLALSQYQRLWDRLVIGGGVVLTKVGPKEARLECLNLPLARIPYFRTAFRGVNEASCELFCAKAYVQEIRTLCSSTSLGYRISWA